MDILFNKDFAKSIVTVKIISAKETLYDGPAFAVSSENEAGPFDVLQDHSKFITVIRKNITVHLSPKEAKQFPIENGVLTVDNNVVRIYIGL